MEAFGELAREREREEDRGLKAGRVGWAAAERCCGCWERRAGE